MSRQTPRIGLLPLMLELYDRSNPGLKPKQAIFAKRIAEALGREIEVYPCDVCNTRAQVAQAVAEFEAQRLDGIVVVHLSYAPSLISVPALTETRLPLLLLNTTPAPCLGEDLTTDDIIENHGIHGVQDLANILLRAAKPYHIVTGHLDREWVVEEAVAWCRAASTASFLRELRVGLIGEPFAGMGDFGVDLTDFQSAVGPEMVRVAPAEVVEAAQQVSSAEVSAEVAEDLQRFAPVADLDADQHAVSVRAGLGLRRVVEQRGLHAVSMNFMAFNDRPEIGTVPFLGISKLQAMGIGYAGEGDIACASLVAAMAQQFGEAAFTEMFCPDWEGDTILMAHMGECNPDLSGQKPVLKTVPFKYGELSDPAVAVGSFRVGPATLVNLVSIGGDEYRLTAAEVEVADFPILDLTMPHFKVRPRMDLGAFLSLYSEFGGSHHLAIVPGHVGEQIELLSDLTGLDFAPA